MSYEQKIINYFEKNYKKIGDDCAYINSTKPVSYTHLTLPTIYSV